MFSNTSTLIAALLIYGIIACFIMKVVIKKFTPDLPTDMKEKFDEIMNGKAAEPAPDENFENAKKDFSSALENVIGEQYRIVTDKKLEDINNVNDRLKTESDSHIDVTSRQFDFILVNNQSQIAIICIEILRKKLIDNESEKTETNVAGVELLRIQFKLKYGDEFIKDQLKNAGWQP